MATEDGWISSRFNLEMRGINISSALVRMIRRGWPSLLSGPALTAAVRGYPPHPLWKSSHQSVLRELGTEPRPPNPVGYPYPARRWHVLGLHSLYEACQVIYG